MGKQYTPSRGTYSPSTCLTEADYAQDTDSKTIYLLPSKPWHSVPSQPQDETLGTALYSRYFALAAAPDQLRPARETAFSLANQTLARQARTLLLSIQQALYLFQRSDIDLSHLPELYASMPDDASVLFEWVFTDYRLGFGIEPDPQESSWYLVTNRNLGEINASGFIHGADLNALIAWLLGFIYLNS